MQGLLTGDETLLRAVARLGCVFDASPAGPGGITSCVLLAIFQPMYAERHALRRGMIPLAPPAERGPR